MVRDVLLLPGGGPHHVHHHRLQQPPGVQPPAGPRPQPLFRGGLVDRSSSILNHNHLQRDFCCSLVLGLHQHPGLLPGRGPVRPAGPPRCFNGDQLTSIYSKHDIRLSPQVSTLPFLAGIVLAALSSSLWQVLLSRCLAGLGDGIMYPNIMGEQESL